MDRIEFRVAPDPDTADEWVTIQPFVNGVPLRDLAAVAERPAAQAEGNADLAGSYAGLFANEKLLWPGRHFLGEPTYRWFEDGDTVLLGCGCGEWGCWPLTARVTLTDSTVEWAGFRTGHRNWDLAALGPFVFDREQYEEALGRGRDEK